MPRPSGSKNTRLTKGETVKVLRLTKQRALDGDGRALVALSNFRLAEAIERTASPDEWPNPPPKAA